MMRYVIHLQPSGSWHAQATNLNLNILKPYQSSATLFESKHCQSHHGSRIHHRKSNTLSAPPPPLSAGACRFDRFVLFKGCFGLHFGATSCRKSAASLFCFIQVLTNFRHRSTAQLPTWKLTLEQKVVPLS